MATLRIRHPREIIQANNPETRSRSVGCSRMRTRRQTTAAANESRTNTPTGVSVMVPKLVLRNSTEERSQSAGRKDIKPGFGMERNTSTAKKTDRSPAISDSKMTIVHAAGLFDRARTDATINQRASGKTKVNPDAPHNARRTRHAPVTQNVSGEACPFKAAICPKAMQKRNVERTK